MIDDDVKALRTGAGARLVPELYTLRLSGPDRVRYLNGMLSNDVAALAPGQMHRAIKANPKGKVEGVLRVRATEDTLELDVLEVVASRVAGALVKLLIMDDATLADATPERDVVRVLGPAAATALEAAGHGPGDLASMGATALGDVTVARDDRYGVPGYDLYVPAGRGEGVLRALVAGGAVEIDAAAEDVLRIEAGVPLDGADVDDDTIPLEARLDEALSFTKGCYVGQETIARAHNLGGVKHILVGFDLGEASPPVGAEVFADGVDKPTGELTSVVRSPTAGRTIALGYVRVVHQEPGTVLKAVWAGGEAAALVRTLPFVMD